MKLISPWNEGHTQAKHARLVSMTVLVVNVRSKVIAPAPVGLLVGAFVYWATMIASTALLVKVSRSSASVIPWLSKVLPSVQDVQSLCALYLNSLILSSMMQLSDLSPNIRDLDEDCSLAETCSSSDFVG